MPDPVASYAPPQSLACTLDDAPEPIAAPAPKPERSITLQLPPDPSEPSLATELAIRCLPEAIVLAVSVATAEAPVVGPALVAANALSLGRCLAQGEAEFEQRHEANSIRRAIAECSSHGGRAEVLPGSVTCEVTRLP